MEVRGWLTAVLGREGRVKEGVPGSDLASASADGKERGQEQPLSRVQQLLSELPVCPAPGAFATPPPVCPSVWERDQALLARYHAYVDDAEKIGWRALSDPTRDEGRELAAQWRSRAIDLSSGKATEQCDGIYWYFQSAAIASLFADGPESEAFVRYRRDAESYRGWLRVDGQVRLFDEYVTVIASGP
ncbi:hypothetical protein [Pseudomonas sp. W2-17]|uniref:hypothetical protein n=1 Tax=Pseudomonas sp. W2-17 TaxID=3058039 RepID=UPI0034E06EA9